MATQKRVRALALAAGAGVLATLVIILMSWEKIAVELHLYRLRREASYLGSVLESPRDSVAWKALQRYADAPDGARELSERFVAGAIEDVFRPGRGLPHFDDISFGALGFGLASDGWRVWCTHQQQSGFDSKYCTRNPDGVDPLHLVRIHELLRGSRAVRAGACGSVKYDGAKLRLFLKDDAFLLTGFRPIHGGEYEHEDLVWVISRSLALPGKVKIASCILPPLVEATRTMTKGEQFFEAARETLCLLEVDPDNPVPGLIQWLQSASLDCNHSLDVHPWNSTRRAHAFWKFIHPAARSLSDMGPSVLPALGESLKKGWTPESVQRALSVYQEIGEPSLPYLEVLLKETTGTVWEASLNAKLSIQRSLRPDYPAEKTRAAPQ